MNRVKNISFQDCAKDNRLPIIHFFVAIGSILIVMQHFGVFIPRYFGGYFMSLFFFTTGYLIPMTLDRCNVKQFAIKRFFRLAPVLWFVVIISLIITTLTKDYLLGTSFDKRLFDAIKVMFCVQDIFSMDKGLREHFILVSWNLTVQIKFYAVIGLSYFLFKTDKERLLFTILSLLCFLRFMDNKFTLVHDNNHIFFVLCIVFICVCGYATYLFKKSAINIIEFIFCIIFVFFIISNEFGSLWQYFKGTLFCIFMVLFFPNVGKNKIVKFFADISYCVYLTHATFIFCPISYFNIRLFGSFKIVCWLVFIFVGVPVCYLIHKYIEKPCNEFGRKLAKKFG